VPTRGKELLDRCFIAAFGFAAGACFLHGWYLSALVFATLVAINVILKFPEVK
jgi:hypothetical protein